MKKILSIFLTLFILLPTSLSVYADNEIIVTVDDIPVDFDTAPIIENDRTLVPMRAIFEALGKIVCWDDEDKYASANDINIEVLFTIGSKNMVKHYISTGKDEIISLDAPIKIVNDRTFVPLRALSEAFGNKVEWDDETRIISITSPNKYASEPSSKSDVPIEIPEAVEAEGTYIQKLMANLPKDKNTVISPFSLKVAMMMVANGTEGETQKEILDVFGVDNIDEFNEYVLSKIKSFAPNYSAYFSDFLYNEELNLDEVKIANSIWFNKDIYKNDNGSFSPQFRNIISKYYNGSAKTVTNDTYASEVNDWIYEKTYGRIPTLISEDNKSNTLLSIISSIYMKAKWWLEFDEENTKKDIFTDIDGNEVTTDFMNKETTYKYYEDEDTQMVRLEYQNHLYMWFVLGDDTDFINKINKAQATTVKLSIPKFKIGYSVDYSKILQSMGVNKAFEDNNSDFSPMFENVPESTKIGSVLQKTIIDVTEKGTEAASITDVDLLGLSRPDETAVFKADRPFTYYIMDEASEDGILFAGRYVKCNE